MDTRLTCLLLLLLLQTGLTTTTTFPKHAAFWLSAFILADRNKVLLVGKLRPQPQVTVGPSFIATTPTTFPFHHPPRISTFPQECQVIERRRSIYSRGKPPIAIIRALVRLIVRMYPASLSQRMIDVLHATNHLPPVWKSALKV